MLGCFSTECKDGQIAAASPVTYVDPKDPPMLLIVGNKEKTLPYHQTLEMEQKLKAAGAQVTATTPTSAACIAPSLQKYGQSRQRSRLCRQKSCIG